MSNQHSTAEGIIATRNTANSISVSISRNDQTEISFYDTISDLVAAFNTKDVFVVADKKVLSLFEKQLRPVTENTHVLAVDISEHKKSWDMLTSVLDEAITSKISRRGAIVAIGGGVVTDMAGLAANLYFRGVRSILIPTTLLGMVDAAVGGKVAVNHPHQKNLIGSFYHPTEILMSSEFLTTVSKRDMFSAAGEILKLAVLSDTELFSLVEHAPENWTTDRDFLNKIISLSVYEKLTMLGANCFERDLERPLNLGHTVAHPLEDITDFQILHGEAVSFGLLIACHISMQRGLLDKRVFERVYAAAKSFGCTLHFADFDAELLWARIRRLIAQRGGVGLLYVLPTALGTADIVNDISKDELTDALQYLATLAE